MQEQIRLYRKAAGLTQAQLAEKMGYESSSAVTMWELGERKVPSDKLPLLAQILNCNIDDLFSDSKLPKDTSEQN